MPILFHSKLWDSEYADVITNSNDEGRKTKIKKN